MTGLRKTSMGTALVLQKKKAPAGLRGGNPLERGSEREAGSLTHTTEICIQGIFRGLLDTGLDKAKLPSSRSLLFCSIGTSVPSSIESDFDILTSQGELRAELFGKVFNRFAFLCKLRGWPWPRQEPEEGGHLGSWLMGLAPMLL